MYNELVNNGQKLIWLSETYQKITMEGNHIMDCILKKRLKQSMLIQLSALVFLFLGFIIAYRNFSLYGGLVTGLTIFLVLSIIFGILSAGNLDKALLFLPMIQAFDIGLIIGSYFTKFEVSFGPDILYVLGFSLGVLIFTHLILKIESIRRKLIILCLIGLFVFFIIGLSMMSKMPLMRELTFLALYHLLTLIGLAIYIFKGEHFGRCISSGFLLAFVIIFIFILILLSEGDIGLDGFDFGGGSGKKQKKTMYH
jgi:hypothetical protein